ncbi:galactoside alpha-(1,2)-fucosyltransferase 2-like [Littorina saxatilis]|uniref:L-Fucosyltransferase n=1 Tax=Littorina saxatilis TaxID=31220 RepID=A0AAN9BGB2_9CAEN
MGRPIVKRLCVAVSVASFVLNMFLLLNIRLETKSASKSSPSQSAPARFVPSRKSSPLSSDSFVSSPLASPSVPSSSPTSKSSDSFVSSPLASPSVPSSSPTSKSSDSFVSSPLASPSVPSSSPTSKSTNSSNNFTRVLCHRFKGRLGNELFQYASTLGLALTLNMTPVFLGSQHLPYVLKTFNQTSADSSTFVNRCKKAKAANEVSCCKFDEKLTHLDPSQDCTVGTYLVSYKYFEHHEPEIRKALTFTDEIRNESSHVVQELRQKHNTSTLIGVHVRRGDMAKEHNIKLGYPQVSPDYLNRSMAFFRSRYPDCVFVVGSNSLQWCKDNVPSGYHVHYLTGHSPAVDMSVLSSMDHTIITFWSFSWWVGFLNAGTTVYVKDFIVNETQIGRQLDGSSFTYPRWVPL